MSSAAVRLICFDLGRVLVRICSSWGEAFAAAGLPLPEKGVPNADARRAISEALERMERGQLTPVEFANLCARPLGIAPSEMAQVVDSWLLGLYPGVPELLTELEQLGHTTACLSNTNARHWELMSDAAHMAGLPLQRLTHRFASHLLQARKPDDATFIAVERATGLVGPEIAFFDDLADNVAAASRRGWRAHLITHPGDPVAQVRAQLITCNLLRG